MEKITDSTRSESKTNRTIEVLSSEVVDQIAAGEVVERPAHLVKELIENALDAGASSVEIEVMDGGRFVQVRDNGSGIPESQLSLALARHATSKIQRADDLFALTSYGFRGEALASIAAVSHLYLTSKTSGAQVGAQIESRYGQLTSVVQVGHPVGTTIRVENLFENLPARLKFMKSASAEFAQVKNVIKAMALAHPQVQFQLRHEGSLVLFYPKVTDHVQRTQAVLEVEPLYSSQASRGAMKALAVFADPNTTVKTGRHIWIFVQNRWVQDRGLIAAVNESYRNLLMHGEFPQVAVWLECLPEEVDVNIHPTKSQIKFADSSLAFRTVQAALREGLEKSPWISKGMPQDQQAEAKTPPLNDPLPESMPFSFLEFQQTQYPQKNFQPVVSDENRLQESLSSDATTVTGYWSSMQVLAQSHLTYILCQSRQGLMIVDQHAAHERVLFEKLMSAWRGGKIEVQNYLIPLNFDLSPEKMEALLAVRDSLKKLGIEVEQMGPHTLAVQSGPALIKEAALPGVLEKLSTEIVDQGGSFLLERWIGDTCATLACHSAIRAGQPLSIEEMRSLLQQMDEQPFSSFCPHGRPVSVDYSLQQIEKDFGRIP